MNFRLNGAGWPMSARRLPHTARHRTVGELDQVERVLHVGIELIDRHQLVGVELAGHAAVQDRQRLGADVLGQLEVLVEAEAERLEVVGRLAMAELVVPAVDDRGADRPARRWSSSTRSGSRGSGPRRCSRRGSAGSPASDRRAAGRGRRAGRSAGPSRCRPASATPCRGRPRPVRRAGRGSAPRVLVTGGVIVAVTTPHSAGTRARSSRRPTPPCARSRCRPSARPSRETRRASIVTT